MDPRRGVPRTDTVLADPRLADVTARLGRERVKAAVVSAQQAVRQGALAAADVVDAALDALPRTATTLRPVLNATGVLLHTNLGRAPLSDAARAALDVAAGTCDVELDLATGERGPRGAGAVGALLAAVPAAAAAHVVNNGAAALALVALTLAQGREMVVARGELVEIGDGFRIPELLEATGARLREVGTTNRVTRADYAAAIGEDTAFVLKVHPSNFVVRGLHQRLRRSTSWPASACPSSPTSARGCSRRTRCCPTSPTPPPRCAPGRRAGHGVRRQAARRAAGRAAARRAGAGAEAVARIRRHPLARAMRVDKLTLAALEATLRGPRPPVRRFLDAEPADLRRRAARLAAALGRPGRRGPRRPRRGGRRRRARRGAAQRGGRAPRALRRLRCGRASPRCSAGSSTGAACSTCAPSRPRTTRRWPRPCGHARRSHRRARRPRQVDARSGRSPAWSPTATPRSSAAA